MSEAAFSTGWDETSKLAEETGGGAFLSLADNKDRAYLVILGPPVAFQSFYDKDQTSSELIVGTEAGDKYAAEHPGARPGFKARFPIFVLSEHKSGDTTRWSDISSKWSNGAPDGADKNQRVWEVNRSVYEILRKLRDRKPFERYIFEVERDGAKGSTKTKYHVFDVGERGGLAALETHINSLRVINLKNPIERSDSDDSAAGATTSSSTTSSSSSTKGKISKEQAATLKSRLKKNREHLNDWCTEFVRKIADLPAARYDEAMKWIDDRVETKEESTEVDPFAD